MHDNRAPSTICFGPFTLDERSGELRKGPTRLKVPDQSIAILRALLQRPGEVVTRAELRERLWPPDTHVDYEAGLNAAVRRLREAINDSADTPQYVETLPRRGYRFVAPVERAPATATLAAAPPSPAAAPDLAPPALIAVDRTPAWIAVAAGVGLLAMVALWAGRSRPSPTPASPVPITRFPGLELDPALSPDGTLVAFAWEGANRDNFDIYVRPVDGSSLLKLTTDPAADHAPAWSPDGHRIAFVRVFEGKREIVVLPALGGPERRLFETAPEPRSWWHGGLSYGLRWTPDGKHLVFGDRTRSALDSAIFLYALETGERRQLTAPPAGLGDIQPAVSPNGRYLAFVRQNPLARGGSVFVQALDRLQPSGTPRPLTTGRPINAFDWVGDSRSVIHDAGPVQPGLWRATLDGGAPTLLLPNVSAFRPSVARSGSAIVYQNVTVEQNIWELPVAAPAHPSERAPLRVVASTSPNLDLQLSPDGRRIAFTSRMSGCSEVWVSNRDGSDPRRVTNFAADGRVGSPAWSADGQRIAFDAMRTGTGNWNVFVVAAEGGPVRALTADRFNNVRPSWSIDGRWIYFGSDRTGDWQIWRAPAAGGTAVRITREGGIEPVVSWDGRRVYYARQLPAQGIWEVPLEGGPEVQVVNRGRALDFDVAESGIFILDTEAAPQATVEMFSFASRQLTTVARLPVGPRFSSYLRVPRDGASVLYVQLDRSDSDIEMLPARR